MLESLIARIGIASEIGDILSYGVNESLDDTTTGYVIPLMVGALVVYKAFELQLQADKDNKDGKI